MNHLMFVDILNENKEQLKRYIKETSASFVSSKEYSSVLKYACCAGSRVWSLVGRFLEASIYYLRT